MNITLNKNENLVITLHDGSLIEFNNNENELYIDHRDELGKDSKGALHVSYTEKLRDGVYVWNTDNTTFEKAYSLIDSDECGGENFEVVNSFNEEFYKGALSVCEGSNYLTCCAIVNGKEI